MRDEELTSTALYEYNRSRYPRSLYRNYYINTANPRGRYQSNINYATYAPLRRWAANLRRQRNREYTTRLTQNSDQLLLTELNRRFYQ